MKDRLVRDSFLVPEKLETERFRLRMLTADDVEKDYETVMSSREHLISISDPENDVTWPEEGMTFEENLEDLKRHQDDFIHRRAFVYTVVTLDESKCLGCVYIYPSEVEEYEVEVYLWARQSEIRNGLEEDLYKIVKSWIQEEWPFVRVAFPGREIDWLEWRNKRI